MTQVDPIRDFKGYPELEQVRKRLMKAATGPREKALIGVLVKSAIMTIRVSILPLNPNLGF